VHNSIVNSASSAEIHHVIRRTPVMFLELLFFIGFNP
jgi:hypothetical protein